MDFSSSPTSPGIAAVVPGKSPVTSMSFHEDGKKLFVASEGDARLQVIDCISGKADQAPLKNDREQIRLVEAT
jgi:hypothetical protein